MSVVSEDFAFLGTIIMCLLRVEKAYVGLYTNVVVLYFIKIPSVKFPKKESEMLLLMCSPNSKYLILCSLATLLIPFTRLRS